MSKALQIKIPVFGYDASLVRNEDKIAFALRRAELWKEQGEHRAAAYWACVAIEHVALMMAERSQLPVIGGDDD